MSAEITNFRGVVSKNSKYLPEAGRYILYACLGCPFVRCGSNDNIVGNADCNDSRAEGPK
jgi:hypothetical protein